MTHLRAIGSLAFAFCILVAAGAVAPAQTYPSRTITLVVPFPAGGTTDSIARALGETLSQSLGQQIVIENVGGAGGTIGATRVARAAPDGYTILLHQPGLAAAATLYPKLPFNPAKDFVGIGLINTAASIIAGRANLPPSSLSELLKWAKEQDRTPTMAHAGVGAFGHLCGVLFAQEVGIKVQQVPYKGGGPALNDLVAGHADLSCLSAAIAGELIKSGKLKGYAIVSKNRFAGLPQVESAVQAGYKNLDLQFWHALFAPAGTPQPTIDRLNTVLRQSFDNARVRAIFDKNGMTLYPVAEQTPAAATAMLRNEIKRWGDVIRANKIEVQQ